MTFLILWALISIIVSGIGGMLSPHAVSAQPSLPQQSNQALSKTRSFQELCNRRDSLPTATRTTIAVILTRTNTNNCSEAATQLNNATFLDLSDTGISDLSPLMSLPHLTKVDLCCNKFSNITPLAALINLNQADLSYNRITNILPLSKLINLTNLDLSYNEITDLQGLSNLINLRILDLSFNQVSQILPLGKLVNLTHLDMWGNQITDLSGLRNLTQLQKLSVTGNPLRSKTCPVSPSSICNFDYGNDN